MPRLTPLIVTLCFSLLAALPAPAAAQAQAQPAPPGTRPYLMQGQVLRTGEFMTDRDNSHFAVLAGNGTLCTHRGARPGPTSVIVECPQPVAKPQGVYVLSMQPDGNLCIYPGSVPAVAPATWCARNAALPASGYFMELTVDGDLVVWAGTAPQKNNELALKAVWNAAGPKRVVRNEHPGYSVRAILYGPRGVLGSTCVMPGGASHVRVLPPNATPASVQAAGLDRPVAFSMRAQYVRGANPTCSGAPVCETQLTASPSLWNTVRLFDEASRQCALMGGGGARH